MKIGILFDLDGTLLDTLGDLQVAVNYALSRFGYPGREKWEIRSFLGNGMRNLIKRSLPDGVSEETVSGIWASPKLEQSLTDEMPALREPYPISLKKGWNHICITTAVGAGEYDMSVASFALFQGPLTHPREVEGLVWKCEP